MYVLAEKILAPEEPLPQSWPVDGTTGYDFLTMLNGLYVDQRNDEALAHVYDDFIQRPIAFHQLSNSSRKMTMLVSLASEVYALSQHLERIAESHRRTQDYTLDSLTFVLREIIACLPVYRTYIAGPDSVSARDQAVISEAVAAAKRRNPRTAAGMFDFVQEMLLLRNLARFSPDTQRAVVQWVTKFQQVTGPVMAKGIEDTAFYVYNRLLSLNEVGGHPDVFGIAPQEVHHQMQERVRQWPHSMLTTSTHDTKRSEDVRARLNVLSELPDEWQAALQRWHACNHQKKTSVEDVIAPDLNDEYLLYQTLVGVWPSESMSQTALGEFRERIAAYMQKATREAKVHTSWVNPHDAYDAAIRDFVYRLLPLNDDDPFVFYMEQFARRIAFFGRFNALAQVLIKCTAPGVPDLYQGNELWNYSLVDPDNRRPVDFEWRQAHLTIMKQHIEQSGQNLVEYVQDLMAHSADGRIKLYVTFMALMNRRRYERLFAEGAYVPLEAVGTKHTHVFAYARTWHDEMVVVVTPRLVVGLTDRAARPPLDEDVWFDTWFELPLEDDRQPPARFRNVFTGEEYRVRHHHGRTGLRMADICRHFPVALLIRLP